MVPSAGGEAVRVTDDPAVEQLVGWLTDGRPFDSGTYEFPLGAGRVIPGWDQGVAGLKVGGKRRLVIGSSLAYGPEGSPPVIGPNTTLVFDVEVLSGR